MFIFYVSCWFICICMFVYFFLPYMVNKDEYITNAITTIIYRDRADVLKDINLFQLWNALACLNAFVKQWHQNRFKVLKWSAKVNPLQVGQYVHEKQRISTWPKHIHKHSKPINGNLIFFLVWYARTTGSAKTNWTKQSALSSSSSSSQVFFKVA